MLVWKYSVKTNWAQKRLTLLRLHPMPYPLSDEESTDSESGIRFKTTNIRNTAHNEDYRSRIQHAESSKRYKPTHSSHDSDEKYYEMRRRRSEHRKHHKKSKYKEYRSIRHAERKSKDDKRDGGDDDRLEKSRSDDDESNVGEVDTESRSDESSLNRIEVESEEQYEPKLPGNALAKGSSETSAVHGPALPPHLLKSNSSTSVHASTESSQESKTSTDINNVKVIGPVLPAHLRDILVENCDDNADVLELTSNESDLDDLIGPLPEREAPNKPAFIKLEQRAQQLKLTGLHQTEAVQSVREEWMTELPAVHTASLGLGPRQFRAKGVPDMNDRSTWTDTPNTKKDCNKNKSTTSVKSEHKLREIKRRDSEQEKMVDRYKRSKQRNESLLNMHRKESEKTKDNKSGDKAERRPFSRDIDLKAHRFDEAQKKSILKKAQLLDTRFSSGESKFL